MDTPKPKPWQERLVESLTDAGGPLYLGECAMWAVQSGSDPRTVHYVFAPLDGGYVCTCKGFRYAGKCRHRIEVGRYVVDDLTGG